MKDSTITPEIKDSWSKAFGDRADDLLGDTDDLMEAFATIKDGVKKGDIDELEVQAFFKHMEEAGVEPRIMSRIADDPHIEYDQKTVDAVKRNATDERTDLDFNERADAKLKEDGHLDVKKIDAEEDVRIETAHKEAEASHEQRMADSPKEIRKQLEADQKEIRINEERKKIVEIAEKCRGKK